MKNEVYSLLRRNKIEKALDLLIRMTADKDHFNDLIIQSSFYYELKRRYRNNQITYDQYILHSNRIVNNLLEITELMQISNESTNIISKLNNKSQNHTFASDIENRPYTKNKYIIVAALLLALAFSYLYLNYSPVKEKNINPAYATFSEIAAFDKYVYHNHNR